MSSLSSANFFLPPVWDDFPFPALPPPYSFIWTGRMGPAVLMRCKPGDTPLRLKWVRWYYIFPYALGVREWSWKLARSLKLEGILAVIGLLFLLVAFTSLRLIFGTSESSSPPSYSSFRFSEKKLGTWGGGPLALWLPSSRLWNPAGCVFLLCYLLIHSIIEVSTPLDLNSTRQLTTSYAAFLVVTLNISSNFCIENF